MTEEQKTIYTEYLNYLELQNKDCDNPKTVLKIYFRYLETCDILYRSVRITDAQEFQHYLSTLTGPDGTPHYAVSTVSTMIGTLTAFYAYLKLTKKIQNNPFEEIQKIKQQRILPRNILNEEDMNTLLANLRNFMKGRNLIERRNRYKAHVLAELMYSTGARINEVVTLTLSDIDLDRGTVRICDTKTNQVRDCILNSYAEKVLRIFINEMREYVLFGKNGGNTEYLFGSLSNIRTVFNRVLNSESEALEFGPCKSHSIRHAVGVHLLSAGCDIRYIQEILGHSSLSSTQIYTRVSKEDLKGVLDRYHPRVFSRSVQDEAC